MFRALRPDIQLIALQQALPESVEPSGGEQVSPELEACENDSASSMPSVELQDHYVVAEKGQAIVHSSSSFTELITSKAGDTAKAQQLKSEVLQTKRQHQLDLERMDKFVKSERQRYENEIQALKDQVRGAESGGMSFATKDLVQMQQLQQEEITRLQQMHKGDIERIQNESKELQQLHMDEVAQMDRLEALVTRLRAENAVLQDEVRRLEDTQETLQYEFGEERRNFLSDQRGLEIEVQRLEKKARDTSGLEAVQALSDEYAVVDAQFETVENRHKLAMDSSFRKYNKDLQQIRADLDFANSRNHLLKEQNEKLSVHEKQVSRLTQEQAQLEQALAAANEEVKQQEELAAQQKQMLRKLEQQVQKISDRLKEAHAYNDELEMQLVQGPSKAESQKLKESLEAQLQSLAGKLKETQSHNRELEEHLAANERERKSLSATLKRVQQYNHELETAAEESIRARNSGASS